jgi:predicted phage-related endonuclease
MFASIDRLVTPEPVADGTVIICGDAERLLECKTSSAFGRQDWGEAGTDQVPTHYLLQCAWYMAVTNCSRTDLAVLIGNSELRVFDIRRDLRLEGLILEQAQRFWYDNVLANEPPAPSNAVDAQILFPIDEPGSRIEADEVDELKGLLMARMGRSQEITHAGRVLATWKNTRPARRLDTTALRCAHPEIAEEFTTTGASCRRFVFRGTP